VRWLPGPAPLPVAAHGPGLPSKYLFRFGNRAIRFRTRAIPNDAPLSPHAEATNLLNRGPEGEANRATLMLPRGPAEKEASGLRWLPGPPLPVRAHGLGCLEITCFRLNRGSLQNEGDPIGRRCHPPRRRQPTLSQHPGKGSGPGNPVLPPDQQKGGTG